MDRPAERDSLREQPPELDRTAPTVEPANSGVIRSVEVGEQGAFDRIRAYFRRSDVDVDPAYRSSDTLAHSAEESPRAADDRRRAEDPFENPTWAPAEVDAQGRRNELGEALLAHDRTINHHPMTAAEFATLDGGPYGQVLGEPATEQRYTDSCAVAASSSALRRLGVADGQRSLISLSLSDRCGYRATLFRDGTYPDRLQAPPGEGGTSAPEATIVINKALDLGHHPLYAELSNPGDERGSLSWYRDLVRPGESEVLIEYPRNHRVHLDAVAPDLSSVTINEPDTGRKVLIDASTFHRVRRQLTTKPDILIRPAGTSVA